MSYFEFYGKIKDRETIKNWLLNDNYLKKEVPCPNCTDTNMSVFTENNKTKHQCPNCKKTQSIFKNTIFPKKTKQLIKKLTFMHSWQMSFRMNYMRNCCGLKTKTINRLRKETILLAEKILKNDQKSEKIGGNRAVVQIYETEYTVNIKEEKVTYKIISGIELSNGNYFFVENKDNSLKSIILENIENKSIIFTESKKFYDKIDSLGFYQYDLKHKKNFHPPEQNKKVFELSIRSTFSEFKKKLNLELLGNSFWEEDEINYDFTNFTIFEFFTEFYFNRLFYFKSFNKILENCYLK